MNMTKLFKLSLFLIAGVLFMQSCKEKDKSWDQRFLILQSELQMSTDRDQKMQLVNTFINSFNQENYPLYEGDSVAVLLYQGDVDNMYVLGDMSDWADFLPMQKIEDTNLFFLRLNIEPDARLEYWFMQKKDGFPMLDPLNPYKVLNGLGTMSELAGPSYVRHPYFDAYKFGEKGSTDLVKALEIPAGILPYSHQLHIYLPPNYENSTEEYATVYVQDGIDYIEFAQASHTIDTLIRSGKIEPVVAVFITPPNHLKAEMPNRMTEYGLNDDYVTFMCDELVPFIEGKYRVKKSAESRLVVGDSFGGLISAYIPFSRPDVFKFGYSQSGYQSFQDDQLIKAYKNSERKPIRLYVDVGTYELQVGANFLPEAERNFTEANRRLKKVLEDKGYDFVYFEYHEGHTWGNWRRHLIDGMIHFFGK